MKKFVFRTAALFLAAVFLLSAPVQAVSAGCAAVMDADTGEILFEKNGSRRGLIASTTKIMSGLLICENCNMLSVVTVPPEAAGTEGSSMYLKTGEKLAVQELLYGMMLSSGNDAAVALAVYCSGSTEKFVQKMNERAAEMGLADTHFGNPHGLDSRENYSTAQDLAVLSAEAMKNPVFAKTVSTKTVRVGGRILTNHNRLLWQLEGAEGIKTGYTRAAGRILCSCVRRNGRKIIIVTMNDPDDWQDHRILCEKSFSLYRQQTAFRAGDSVGERRILSGIPDRVPLLAAGDFSCWLLPGESAKIRLPKPEFAYAPVVQGQDAGIAGVYIGERRIGEIPLQYGITAEIGPDCP